jgi:malonyl-CoA O-methyltransferase
LTQIWRHTEAATHSPVFFLPGWGFAGRIIELTGLPWIYPEGLLDPISFQQDLLAFLDQRSLGRIRLAGWSMGAHLALDFAREHPDRVEQLYLLAMRRQWPETLLDEIRREFSRDPAGFLAAFYRKCFLGERSHYQRFQIEMEGDWLQDPPLAVLHRGLDYLAQARIIEAPVRTLLVHGRRDIIVPLAEQAALPAATMEVLQHAGHLLFLAPEFSLAGQARKEKIRSRFSQAAPTYDRHASIQKEAALLLAARLPQAEINSILELGSGTGSYTLLLADRYPQAAMLAVDFSAAMLHAAGVKLGRRAGVQFQCEDGEEFLARNTGQFDLITSNATLQWFVDLEAALARISRALSPGGTFLAAFFGPATLEELRQGLSFLLDREVVLPSGRFLDADTSRQLLARNFHAADFEEIRLSRQYDSLLDLLHHIRHTGTAGWREEPPPVFTRERLRRLDSWFGERFGGYRLTYQIFLMKAEK